MIKKLAVNMYHRFTNFGSPHFFSGRSAIKLLIHNFTRVAMFLLEKRPDQDKIASLKFAKNTKSGKCALVLGNGPSLNKLIPTKVHDYVDDIFVVNEFCLNEVSNQLVPTFYVLSDGNSFKSGDTGSAFSIGHLSEYLAQNNVSLILPHTADSEIFNSPNAFYFDDREFIRGKRIDPTRPRNYVSVTLYKALAVAQHMGYDKIYVLGLDNTEFCAYRGTVDNRILHTRKYYAFEKEDFLSSDGGRIMDELKFGIAGRMESYALLFGDLFKYKTIIPVVKKFPENIDIPDFIKNIINDDMLNEIGSKIRITPSAPIFKSDLMNLKGSISKPGLPALPKISASQLLSLKNLENRATMNREYNDTFSEV